MEPHYIEIPHRFYIEKYLEKADQLVDYKFHCLNGEPQFVLTCSNRKSNGDKAMQVTLDLFDMDWKPIPEIVSSGLEHPGNGELPKPENLDDMVCWLLASATTSSGHRCMKRQKPLAMRFQTLLPPVPTSVFTPSWAVVAWFCKTLASRMVRPLAMVLC